jgi:UDPglucose--hexose-1-phosphate uridylyltransferase
VTRLADGRQLIYFDESPAAVRGLRDRRDLPASAPDSHLRFDPLVREWVAYAAHRQARTFLPPVEECPLCPSTGDSLTEIPDPAYDVVVFENRFPSFNQQPAGFPDHPPLPPLTPSRTGQGRCEVVCFTSDHHGSFATLTPERVRTVLDVLVDRTVELSGLPGVEQVFCFENRGVEIGVTLDHPHGQIYAYPFVAPRTVAMAAASAAHAERTGGNLFADLLAAERASGDRVVAANGHWTAFVPAAARWPFEIVLAPARQVPDLPALTPDERTAFGPLYLDVLRRLDALFGTPAPYVSAWHQAPVRQHRDLSYLHLQLFSVRRATGKLKYLAGSESAMGAFVNDIVPEQAARAFRAAVG